ncbi:MAG: M1 family metallopeptidase [Chitinophagaceae bacterium]|nr:M1 family metallopeptidase [Chitinophagaceae bacterium]MBL0272990.1 M1 family metallopeptidase [Chitinophagaceae bacterium]
MARSSYLIIFSFFLFQSSNAQPLNRKEKFSHEDTLRGSITPERAWWNVVSYNIYVAPDFKKKMIRGWNQIGFDINSDGPYKKMQIDLQQPMVIDSIIFNNKSVTSFTRKGNVYIIDFGSFNFISAKTALQRHVPVTLHSIKIYFQGLPREAVNPPWDGGWIWKNDDLGRPWMSVACQGLGASVWYPCKDHQSDEPDQGALIQVRVPDSLVAVSNGRLYSKDDQKDGTLLYTWQVKNPINNYNIVPYIGKYVHFADNFMSETGKNLSLDYWVLDYNLGKAKKQFGRDVKPMLKAFEYWFGPFPFFEDGYKLVESSHLGMEHQSATAYGNHYLNGYLGSDLSGSGWGLKWDYIIVHESAHEWFANNITTNDIADMWIHEGFAMYAEALFVEYQYGKKAADEYVQGIRKNISNNKPLIGHYDVNQEGSNDMYNKGANLLHTIRQVINNDSVFRKILRGLNKDYYHQTVDSKDVEAYFSRVSQKDLSKIFDQYLRTIKIPVLEYKMKGRKISYRWVNCIDGFNMPVQLMGGRPFVIYPKTVWQNFDVPLNYNMDISKNYYISLKKTE